MINVMASDKIDKSVMCNRYELPAANSIQLKANNEVSIQRSILHLITTPELRAAHVFHFKDGCTDWRVFEPYQSPLTSYEVRGAMVYAIKQFREPTFLLSKTKIRATSFIRSVNRIVQYLESFKQKDKIYIILIFKHWSYAIGNYFDETSICQALLEYRPRKPESVIRNTEKDKLIFIQKAEDLTIPKVVRFPAFSL